MLPGLLAAAAYACGDEASPGSSGATPPVPEGGSPSDARATDGGEAGPDASVQADSGIDAASLLLPCSAVTFCDDFEGPTPLPRGWRTSAEANGAKIGIEAGAGAKGSAGLVAFAPGTGAGDQEAILLFDADGGAPATWGARIAFNAKVSGDGSLAGPRLLTYDLAGGDNREVLVRFDASPTKTTARIDYFIIPCPECADPPATKIDVGNGWHHYLLDIAATPGGTKATGHGRMKLHVDGVVVIDAPLGIPLSSMPRRTLDFGITSALDSAKGTFYLDDAYFELR